MRKKQRKSTHTHHFKFLAERIEEASWKLKTDWQPTLSATKQEYEEALLADAAKLKTHLNRAALQWISTDTFPRLTAKETFFLELRFMGAWHLLYQLELENGSTFFRPTSSSESEFLAWLLTKWGHEIGTIEGFDIVINSWKAKKKIRK